MALVSEDLERELDEAGVADCAVGAERREAADDVLGALEAKLDAHVAAYVESPAEGREARICEVIEAARLSKQQVELLKKAQDERGATLVAYARPVRLRRKA